MRKSVKESYDARDQAKEDMTQLVKQFELDKFERHKEWTLYSQAIDEADKEGHPSSVTAGVQGMTKEQEADIRKKIRAGMLVMAKEKGVLQVAKAKVSAYNEALAFVRSQTGYEDLQDVIDLFNKYEQEKYEKLGAISRLVSHVGLLLGLAGAAHAQAAPAAQALLFARPSHAPPPATRTLFPRHPPPPPFPQLVEIERNEVELQGSRMDVQVKETSTAALKQQRAKQLAFLEDQARSCEERASESLANANRVSSEVKTVLVAMEMLFYTLAAGQALTVPSQLALTSPTKSRPTASLKMYSSPALVQAVHEGSSITMSSLPSFMGMMENRASDLIQTYAAKVTIGEVKEDGEVLDAEEAAEQEALAEDKLLQEGAEAAEALAEGGDAAAAALMAKMEGEASKEEAAATKRFFSPAALGPSKPTGKLKESLTTSAMVAAMSISAGIGGDEGGAGAAAGGGGTKRGSASAAASARAGRHGALEEAEEEEEASGKPGVALRPISLEEIKRQAMGSISADRTVRAIGSAAAVAALVLGRGNTH